LGKIRFGKAESLIMKNSIRLFVSTFLVLTFVFNNLPSVFACGPYTIMPRFSLVSHADYPLIEYTNGKIGIVPKTYGWMSLFVFYRYLNGLPLSRAEQVQVEDAMHHRIGKHWSESEYALKENKDSQEKEQPPDYLAKWKEARAKILSDEEKISTEKLVPSGYNYFSNCLPDAFRIATKTLEARIASYGTKDVNVREWLSGQDAVFSNCNGAGETPTELSESSSEWLRRDRQYQIAAAHFYAARLPEARTTFEKIAADENSSWRKTAKFVIARTYIRQSSFIEIPETKENEISLQEKERDDFLRKASAQLENVLADASMKDFHESAHRLLGLVKYRLIPQERVKELAHVLVRPVENRNIYNDLTDYSWLLNFTDAQAESRGVLLDLKQAEQEKKEYDYNYETKLRDIPMSEREKDLTDWIFTYIAADGFTHAFEKWKQTGKLHWLAAVVVNTKKDTPQLAEILREADKIQRTSPAFATVRYHQIQILLETGKLAEAKQKLTEVFANNLNEFPLSAQNKFLAQRTIIAENLNEFLKYAQRKPSIFVWSDDAGEEGDDLDASNELKPWKNRAMFDEDAVAFINEKMPLSVLRQAALNPQLPEHLKKFLVTAVWTRAFALGNQAIEREFTPLMLRYAKEFSPHFSKYASATGAANREADALIAILRYPVIQPYVPVGFGREDSVATEIDSTRGNWWCVADEKDKSDRERYDHYPFHYPASYPNFLTKEQMATAARELRQMLALGDSSTFLARRAVEFAVKNPNHPQTPEILHLAVRSTRYGCKDEKTGDFSKQAFQILHKRYPKSEWTKKTQYWFGLY
jgi:hypothetical protein